LLLVAIDVYKPKVIRWIDRPEIWNKDLMDMLQDATTNPSLILAAANKPGYAHLIDAAVNYGKQKGGDIDAQANAALDRLVRFTDVHSSKLNG
jgi:transaldolase